MLIKHNHDYVLLLLGRSGRAFRYMQALKNEISKSSAMVHKFVAIMTKDVDSGERKIFSKH